jgi:hypothetical protein
MQIFEANHKRSTEYKVRKKTVRQILPCKKFGNITRLKCNSLSWAATSSRCTITKLQTTVVPYCEARTILIQCRGSNHYVYCLRIDVHVQIIKLACSCIHKTRTETAKSIVLNQHTTPSTFISARILSLGPRDIQCSAVSRLY